MHKETGEIRPVEQIPKTETEKWSNPFKVGDIVEIFGVKMRLIKIKTMRQELHFKFVRKDGK